MTIRICEESEARLMIKDGSFKEYVQGWSERFPQKPKLHTIKGLRDRHGLGLQDAMLVSRSMGIDEDVFFEVGENVCLRKRNNNMDVFQKVGTIWVENKNGMSAFESADLFDNDRRIGLTLCTEDKLLNSKSVTELARSVEKRMLHYKYSGDLMPFGNHELWEWNNRYSFIEMYSHKIKDMSFYCTDEKNVVEQIRRYRETYRIPFGSF